MPIGSRDERAQQMRDRVLLARLLPGYRPVLPHPAGNVKRGNSRKRRAAGVPGGHVSRLTVGFTIGPLIGVLSRSPTGGMLKRKGSCATDPASQCRGAERDTLDLRYGDRPMSFPSWPVNQYSGLSLTNPRSDQFTSAWMTLQAEHVIAPSV